jgi:hypothetical protein
MIERYWLMIADFSYRVHLYHMDLDTHHLLLKMNGVDDLWGEVGETALCSAVEIENWSVWGQRLKWRLAGRSARCHAGQT